MGPMRCSVFRVSGSGLVGLYAGGLSASFVVSVSPLFAWVVEPGMLFGLE